MSEKHTQGRLTVNPLYPIQIARDNPVKLVAQVIAGKPYTDQEAVDIARRLVACWNACEGMEDPEAEVAALRKDSDYLMASERLRAKAIEQRDELLAALASEYYALADVHNNWPGRETLEGQQRLCRLRDLIASVTGLTSEQVQNGEAWDLVKGGGA